MVAHTEEIAYLKIPHPKVEFKEFAPPKQLSVLEGSDTVRARCFSLPKNKSTKIGRGLDCDIRIPDDDEFAKVSRNHALITWEDIGKDEARFKGFVLIDLNSSNHTFANNQMIKRHALHRGDVINLADVIRIIFWSEPVDPQFVDEVETRRVEDLTDRQRQILELIAKGKTNKQIAIQLHITAGTVKTHKRQIFGRLGAEDTSEAIRLGQIYGYLK